MAHGPLWGSHQMLVEMEEHSVFVSIPEGRPAPSGEWENHLKPIIRAPDTTGLRRHARWLSKRKRRKTGRNGWGWDGSILLRKIVKTSSLYDDLHTSSCWLGPTCHSAIPLSPWQHFNQTLLFFLHPSFALISLTSLLSQGILYPGRWTPTLTPMSQWDHHQGCCAPRSAQFCALTCLKQRGAEEWLTPRHEKQGLGGLAALLKKRHRLIIRSSSCLLYTVEQGGRVLHTVSRTGRHFAC